MILRNSVFNGIPRNSVEFYGIQLLNSGGIQKIRRIPQEFHDTDFRSGHSILVPMTKLSEK